MEKPLMEEIGCAGVFEVTKIDNGAMVTRKGSLRPSPIEILSKEQTIKLAALLLAAVTEDDK